MNQHSIRRGILVLLSTLLVSVGVVLGAYTPQTFDRARDGGAFQWGSKMVTSKNVTEKSKPQAGYVVTTGGARVEGSISLKVVNDRLDEIRLEGADGKKTAYPRAEIAEFGINAAADEFTQKALAQAVAGTITLKDGTELAGQVRPVTPGSDKVLGFEVGAARDIATEVQLVAADDQIVTYRTDDASGFRLLGAEGPQEFVTHREVFVRIVAQGGGYLLFRNPYPTHDKLWATFGARVASDAVSESVAKEAAKHDDVEVQESGSDPSVKKLEWVLRDTASGQEQVLWNKNVDQVLAPLLGECARYSALTTKELQEMVTIDAAPRLVAELDACKN